MKNILSETKKIISFVKKDIKIELSYKLSLILQISSIFLFSLVFFFLARMINGQASEHLAKYNGDYFSFALVGMAFYSFFAITLNSFSSKLREEQLTGTLEAVFLTPIHPATFLAGISAFNILRGTLHVLIFLVIGTVFLGAKIVIANGPILLIVFILSVLNFIAIGIIASSFILVFKRGNPVNWVIDNIFLLAGGVIYPVSVLPGWTQKISGLLPITYSLDALRASLIPGADISSIMPQITCLGISAAILFPIAIFAFQKAIKTVKEQGTLSQY